MLELVLSKIIHQWEVQRGFKIALFKLLREINSKGISLLKTQHRNIQCGITDIYVHCQEISWRPSH